MSAPTMSNPSLPNDVPSDMPASETPTPETCPKCNKVLIDPTGLGWCAGCGYCKSLDESRHDRLLTPSKRPSIGAVVEAGGAVAGSVGWLWGGLVFIALGVGFSYYNGVRLAHGEDFPRALWATLQIAIGLFMTFGAQIIVLIAIAPEYSTLSFKDALVPVKLWSLAIRNMPRLQGWLWTAVLGLSLAISSPIFIGGLGHWFTYLPKSAAELEKERAKQGQSPGKTIIVPVD